MFIKLGLALGGRKAESPTCTPPPNFHTVPPSDRAAASCVALSLSPEHTAPMPGALGRSRILMYAGISVTLVNDAAAADYHSGPGAMGSVSRTNPWNFHPFLESTVRNVVRPSSRQ